MLRIFFLSTLVLLTSFTTIQEKFVKVAIGKNITVKVPESFHPMTESEIASEYISTRKPVAVFTSADRQADFGVNVSITQWGAADLAIMKDFFKASILELHTETQFLNESIETINGKDFAVFEFISIVKDEDVSSIGAKSPIRKYNYLQYTVFEKKTYVYNFNCPANQQEQWRDTAHEIMESVTMKKE